MNRHPFDPIPALTGALIAAVGLTYVLADLRDESVREALVGIAAVAGLGLLAFAATLRAVLRSARRRSTGDEVSASVLDADAERTERVSTD